jgi:hypothetical protein
MIADSSANDFLAFRDFVGTLADSGQSDLTPEQSVTAFRAYQRQLAQFQAGNREAMEQSERGESKSLDVESLIQRVRARAS